MLHLGPIPLTLPAVQAALSGYSDLPMRRVARRRGAPFCFHEVVLDRLVVEPGKTSRRILEVRPDDHPLGGQLMGSEPRLFAQAAQQMVAAGFDLVDLNFGCPVPRHLGRCRGGFLLGEPESALAIISAVLDAVGGRVPVMVKLRRGVDDSAAAEAAFFKILEGAFARGIAAVIVHARTVQQRYAGRSRWEFLAKVKRAVGARTVLGSGDLFSPFAAQRLLRETGIDGVSFARGAIGNPWIFTQLRDLLAGGVPMLPSLAEQREALTEHWAEAVQVHGRGKALGWVRAHAIQYARLHPEPIRARDTFVACKSAERFEAVLAELYAEGRFPATARALLAADAPDPCVS